MFIGKTTYVFFTIIFRLGLLPYLKLVTTCMKINTLINHKEVVVCEKNGPINMSYNVLLTTLEVIVGVKPIVLVVTAISTLTYTNCGKIGHLVETCHNIKKEVPVLPTVTIKSKKHVVGTKTQPIKLGKIHDHYPCKMHFSVEHRSRECPRKIEVQNMFIIKPIIFNAMTTFKPQQEELLWDLFIETIKQLRYSGFENQPTTINEGSFQSYWVRLHDNPTTIQLVERN
jgi:hypothetical protein